MKIGSIILVGFFVSLSAMPASAQLWFVPEIPTAPFASGATTLSLTYGHGLNEPSARADAVGISLNHTDRRFSFSGAVGRVTDAGGLNTFGGSVGYQFVADGDVGVSVRAGSGWISSEVSGHTLTRLRFPLGVAFQRKVHAGASTVLPWMMPRLTHTTWSTTGGDGSATDPGASAGLSFIAPSGVGIHATIDAEFAEFFTVWRMGFGLQYSWRP